MEHDERRQQVRARAPRIVVRIPDAAKLRDHYLGDLAQGGLFVRAGKTLPLGTEVELALLPPGWTEPLALAATVVRVVDDAASVEQKSSGFAVRFERLTPELDGKLRALVAEYMPGGSAAAAPQQVAPAQAPAGGAGLEAARALVEAKERAYSELQQRLEEATHQLGELRLEKTELLARCQGLSDELDRRASTPALAPATAGQELEQQLEAAQRESGELRIRLAEAEGQTEALQSELASFETDEAQSRALSEKLALQLNRLEKQRKKELEDAAAQLASAQAELAAATSARDAERSGSEQHGRELAAARAEKTEVEARLVAEQQRSLAQELRCRDQQRELDSAKLAVAAAQAVTRELPTLRDELVKERAKSAGLSRQLEETRTRHERLVVKERDLRRLLELVSSGKGDEEVLIDDGEDEAPSRTFAGEAPPGGEPHDGAPAAGASPLSRSLFDEEPAAEAAAAEPFGADPFSELPVEEPFGAGSGSDPFGGLSPAGGLPGADPFEGLPLGPSPGKAPPAARQPRARGGVAAEPDLPSVVVDQAAVAPLEAYPGEDQAAEVDPLDVQLLDDEPLHLAQPAAPPLPGARFPGDPFAPPPAAPAARSRVGIAPIPRDPFAAPPRSLKLPDLDEPPPPPAGQEGEPLVAELEVEVGTTEPEELLDAAAAAAARELAAFEQRFRGGAKLHRTQRFNNFTPIDPVEVRVSGWLEQADSFDGLRRLAHGRLPDDRLCKAVFELLKRGLVELVA